MTFRKSLLISVLFVVGLAPGQLIGHAGQSPTRLTLVTARRLLDPRTGNLLSPAAALIEAGRIKEVGAPSQLQAHAPTGVATIDLGNTTLMPGLIDSHTHLLLDVIPPTEPEIKRLHNGEFLPGQLMAVVMMTPGKRVLFGARLAREDLESGFTTVRNLGHSGIDGDTELRDAINAGRIPGPRLLAAGRKLITRGDYLQNLNPALADAILQQEFLLLDGADRARQAVRQNVFQNVDVIKVTVEENLTIAELTAVVEEAHRQHLKVAAHATDTASIQTAIDAGADSIEHGNEATSEQLRRMRDKGIFFDLTPTFYDDGYLKIAQPTIVISPAYLAARGSAAARNKQRY